MLRFHIVGCALLGAAALSCGDTTTNPPSQLNLDRPIDMAFTCYGGLRITDGAPATPEQDVVISAQPPAACNVRSGPHAVSEPVPVPVGQENLTMMGGAPIPAAFWYGFILQSGPGTVAIAQFPTKPSTGFAGGDVNMLDADPLTPGKNGISVGEDPIAIATDNSGCYQVIANAGSCDLSALDVTTALDTEPDVRVTRIEVTNASNQVIDAKPAAMVAQPSEAVIGGRCPATPTGIAYVAYPSCHLVAAVDTSSGRIVAGVQFDAAGIPTITDGNVSCPSECDGGGMITTGIRPVTVDLERDPRTDTRRLAIGADNSPSITIVELGADYLPTGAPQRVALEDTTGSLGVTHVAMSPTIGMGGNNGVINDDIASGGDFQFVYAIATDDTVRVADILTVNRECDTQVDPRLINAVTSVKDLSCFPVGEPTTPRRRAGAKGPGIELFGDAIPTSVEVFRAAEIEQDPRLPGPTKLVGYFGVITATNGGTFLLNIDDDDYFDAENLGSPLEVTLPLAIAHQIRHALPAPDLRALDEVNMEVVVDCEDNGPDPDAQGGNFGGPRSTGFPSRNVPAGVIAPEKTLELPGIRQVLCTDPDTTKPVSELGFPAPDAVRDLAFPDIRAMENETWSLTWQGSLSNDKADADVDGPSVRVGEIIVDGGGMRIVDQSQPFCDAGVEQFDIVQLRGCDSSLGDAECPLGYTCFVHPNSQVVGLGACMLEDEADRLAEACKDFLTSARRYTVGRAASGELRLLPRKNVLRTTPLDGCVDDTQCEALADYAVELASSAHPVADMTAADARTWACRVDPDRTPLDRPGQTGKRCVEVCTQTSDCSTGRVCQGGYCMEGVTPPQACVNAPQRFELRAGDAFTAVGTRTGYVHSTILDQATGKCMRDPNASPYEIGRIELNPPPCDPAADPRTGRLADGSYEPNPCSLTTDQVELAPAYLPGTCEPANPATALQTRQAPAIKFRNRALNLTIVDPYYPGDAQCIRDRMGMQGKVPLVFPGFQLAWRQTGGFVPLTLPLTTAAFPIRVVRGPTQSIWVIDQGDFLSTSVTQPSTRGKVFRIEAQAPGLVNILE